MTLTGRPGFDLTMVGLDGDAPGAAPSPSGSPRWPDIQVDNALDVLLDGLAPAAQQA